MRNLKMLFFQFVVSVATENPLRDKIRISSCENLDGYPEMKIIGPEFMLNGKASHTEPIEIIEKIVDQEDLIMKTNDKGEFKLYYGL